MGSLATLLPTAQNASPADPVINHAPDELDDLSYLVEVLRSVETEQHIEQDLINGINEDRKGKERLQVDPGAEALNPDEYSTDDTPSTPRGQDSEPVDVPPLPTNPEQSFQSVILPKPASHALLYTTPHVPIVAGHVAKFLSDKVTQRLDLGWQLRYLSQGGKWDVKNLEKWRKVQPVS